MNLKYKSYWRKSGLKAPWGDIYFDHLKKHNPNNFLEIGVFCGVTARNTCDYLSKIHGNNFNYIGVDYFGSEDLVTSTTDEIQPSFLQKHKFSNPLKNFYYNIIKRENINSLESITKLLKKYAPPSKPIPDIKISQLFLCLSIASKTEKRPVDTPKKLFLINDS